jgi:hypothetical protein
MDSQPRITQKDLDDLKSQIVFTEKNFRSEVHLLYEKFAVLQKKFDSQFDSQVVIEQVIQENQQKIILEAPKKVFEESYNSEIKKTVKTEPKVVKIQSVEHKKETYKPKTPSKPSEISLFLAEVFLPFTQFVELFSGIYLQYKAQNRLPVFFMTIGGIGAILLGFGYLMQYASATYFELIKVGGSFLASFGIVFWGTHLIRTNKKYTEFGSALLGLSIAINYLILFNLASDEQTFPLLSQPMVNFGLMALNTLLALWLALRYETRIVMIISLLGGVFTPLYVAEQSIALVYFFYLLGLSVAVLFVAAKIKWKVAEIITFFTASIALRMALELTLQPSLPIFSVIFMLFAYLFYYVSLFENKKPKANLDRSAIIILAGTSSLLLFNLYEMYITSPENIATLNGRFTLGLLYLANALIFVIALAILMSIKQQISAKIRVLYFILIGTFVAFAIPTLLERDLSGILWSIEAIALIFCGFNFSLPGVRKEGYIILAIGFLKIFDSFSEIIDNWTIILWTDGFWNLLSFGGILAILKVLFLRYSTEHTPLEKSITYSFSEALPIWLAVSVFIPTYFYLGIQTYNLAIFGLYGLVWWGLRYKLIFTEIFGLLCLGVIGLGVYESYLETRNLVFAFQTIFGKLAMAEIYLSLWFLEFFYEKINQKSLQLPLMRFFREVFYLIIPFLHLSFVNRNYPEYLPVAFWGSLFSGFILYKFVKRKALLVELHLLIAFATYSLLNIFENSVIAYLSIGSGIGLLGLIFLIEKGFEQQNAEKSPFKLIFIYLFYFIGGCIFLLSQAYTQNEWAVTWLATSFYFLLITYFFTTFSKLYLGI